MLMLMLMCYSALATKVERIFELGPFRFMQRIPITQWWEQDSKCQDQLDQDCEAQDQDQDSDFLLAINLLTTVCTKLRPIFPSITCYFPLPVEARPTSV